jgi:opacity protein-like surface antigen
MRIPSLLFVSALAGSSSWAHHEENPYYVQLGLGAVFSEDADVGSGFGGSIGFDPGYSTSLALGRNFELTERWSWDAQVETVYQRFTVDEDEIGSVPGVDPRQVGDLDVAKTLSFFVNGILDWHLTRQFALYGGIGVGWAKTIDYNAWDQGSLQVEDDDGLAFQARLGMSYNLGGSYLFQFGYRYLKTDAVDVTDLQPPVTSTEIDIGQHTLELGFRWGL